MKLVGSNRCPVCGKQFKVQGDCRINYNQEFYGGRVKFFQKQTCDCYAVYDLLISETENGLRVIDLDLVKIGEAPVPVNETEEREPNEQEKIVLGLDSNGKEISTEKSTLVVLENYEETMAKLEELSKLELIKKCTKLGVKVSGNMSKAKIIDKYLEVDPAGKKL